MHVSAWPQGSDRRRLQAVVAIAVVAGLAAGAAALAMRSHAPARAPLLTMRPLTGRPPLLYALPARYQLDLVALHHLGDGSGDADLALAEAAAESRAGQVAGASRALDVAARRIGAQDPRIRVGRLLLAYDNRHPARTVAALQGVAGDFPSDPLPAYAIGVADLWSGHATDAFGWLRQVLSIAPDTIYGERADDLLHPGIRDGYPLWVPEERLPHGSSAALAAGARAHPDSAPALLAEAASLQGSYGHIAARRAALQAVAVASGNLDARVAAAVLGFDKSAPGVTTTALDRLVAENPRAASPIFHRALVELWLQRSPSVVRADFAAAARLDPHGGVGTIARKVLARLPP